MYLNPVSSFSKYRKLGKRACEKRNCQSIHTIPGKKDSGCALAQSMP